MDTKKRSKNKANKIGGSKKKSKKKRANFFFSGEGVEALKVS